MLTDLRTLLVVCTVHFTVQCTTVMMCHTVICANRIGIWYSVQLCALCTVHVCRFHTAHEKNARPSAPMMGPCPVACRVPTHTRHKTATRLDPPSTRIMRFSNLPIQITHLGRLGETMVLCLGSLWMLPLVLASDRCIMAAP